MSGPMAVVHPPSVVHQSTTRMTSPDCAATTTVSRLQQMQARFQQKQQQEKEQKLLALYADQAQQAYARINNGGGRVRQLFQERRGLDRSYPLQPLEGRRGTSLDRGQQLRGGNNTKRNNSHLRGAPPRYPSAGYEGDDDFYYQPQPPIYTSQQRLDQDYTTTNTAVENYYDYKTNKQQQQPQPPQSQQIFGNENDYISKSSYDLDSGKLFKKLPNIGSASLLAEQKETMAPAKVQNGTSVTVKKSTSVGASTQLKTGNRNSDAVGVKSVTKSMAKLTPPSKKTEVKSVQNSEQKPKAAVARRPTPVPLTNNVVTRPASASSTEKQKSNNRAEVKMTTKSTVTGSTRGGGGPQRGGPTPPRGAARVPITAAAQGDLTPCSICGRSFASDRIAAHQNICAKTTQKKRKQFDPVKQRLSGTGAEKYLRKGKPAPPPANLKKSNWRKKHEEFINNIRAAKQAQAHVAAGGKLSDLPPPPPLDTSDYTPCPHCGRKFNEAAAARHIPKCATMLHNKPKPNAGAGSQATRKRY